jgi:hypothetical protein
MRLNWAEKAKFIDFASIIMLILLVGLPAAGLLID